jgi:hypothetical protein
MKKAMNRLPHLMDNTDASSLGFGRNPERSTRSSNDHHSKLCINVGWKSVRYETHLHIEDLNSNSPNH